MANGVQTANIIDPNDDTRFVAVDPYVIEGVPRALVITDGNKTTIGYSMNVSSIDDIGTGDYRHNFTNAFDNATNIVTASMMKTSSGFIEWKASTTTSVDYRTENTAASATDREHSDAIFGLLT